MALLQIEYLHKRFGALAATDNLSLQINHGELHALIGPNGAGKTTLISLLSGSLQPDSGLIKFDGRNLLQVPEAIRPRLGLVRSFQITSIFPEFSALENVTLVLQSQQGHSFRFWKVARNDFELRSKAKEYLKQVGLDQESEIPAYALAHGQQRQLELAMALALEPKLLLLDEPMAGMGPEESLKVVELLQQLKGKITMLLIEHDMDAVFSVADRVSVLVYGNVIATGTPSEIRENTEVCSAYLGEHEIPVAN